MNFQVAVGHEIQEHIKVIAALRITVFREYPYLYDGDLQTEVDYLNGYSASENSILMVVKDGEKIVGAVTGKPLAETEEIFLTPFVQRHLPTQGVFYLGEIMLLQEYRGKGIGHQLYRKFEEAVRQKRQYQKMAIVEIVRQSSSGHRFWHKLGYKEHPEMVVQVPYKEIDSPGKILHSLVYSFKEIQ